MTHLCTLFFLILLLCQGCSHHPAPNVPDMSLTLHKVENVALGTLKDGLEQSFGQPQYVAGPYPEQNTVEWFYGKGHYNRAAFLMDGASSRVTSKFWNIEEGDPERKLEVALARYPQAHFMKRDSKFIHAHRGHPTDVWYEDQALGLSILVKKATNEVDAIYWCSVNEAQTDATCLKTRMDRDWR